MSDGPGSVYAAALRDPRWQKVRLEVFARDGWCCVACGSARRTLHVHHRRYHGGEPWDTSLDELQTLCEACHAQLKGIRPGSVEFIEGGFSYDGRCPYCNSANIREKGSFDKCMDCGKRIAFWPVWESD